MHAKVATALFLSSLAMAAPAITEEPAGVGIPVMTEAPLYSVEQAVASAIPQSIREQLSSAYLYGSVEEIESIGNYVLDEFMHNSAWAERLPASDLAILSSEVRAAYSTAGLLIPPNSSASLTAGSSTPLATATGTNSGSGSDHGSTHSSDSTSTSTLTSTSTSTTASGSKPTTTNGATAPTAHVAASFAGAAGLLGFMLAL
ncbi:hypothetical protein N7510_008995 [Penicillium lagena]|uniref:uncharacterized protein n=1 Tax=Penicillium lagena TaxID=94218 RepID=UPI002541A4CA|nr:uncharacterized protein N7510_008995 [Penicillium lagena]KAJ5606214.1 hypothetical protein N7510_008995 [Penicillium lagena]